MRYRNDIQGLRALAVLFVFIFHLNPNWLPGGFIGVDVFFVISGFLMASIILRSHEDNSFRFTEFYLKRIKRIVPAYYVMLLCTALAATFILIGNDVHTFARELKHATGFNSNYCYAKMSSYFGMKSMQSPLLHTWTIAVEMKFYLLLPLLFFFVRRKYLPFAISAIAILLLLYCVYEIQIANRNVAAYYSVLVRIPEFCMGILAALVPLKLSGYKGTATGIAGLTLLMGSAVFYNHSTPFPGVMALLPCAGAMLLLLTASGPVNKLLSAKLFEKTGALSYSVYLWHWPVMALTRYYAGESKFSPIQMVAITVFTAVFAWLSYTFIEEYYRRKKTKTFVFAISPVCLAIAAVYFCMPKANERIINIPQEYREPVFGMKSHNAQYVETFGDSSTAPEILLIGNSHALSMKPYLDILGRKHHFSFRTVTSNSYLAISGLDGNKDLNIPRYGDFELSQKQVAITEYEISRARIIVMVTSSWDMLPTQIPALRTLVSHLSENQQLIFVTPFPTLNKNPVEVNRGFIKDKSKQQKYRIKYRKQTPELMVLVNEYPNVHFISLEESNAFKDAPYYNDTLMYYDARHLNRFGALKLAQHTEAEFMQLLDSLR